MISHITRGTRTILSAPKSERLICCQCAGKASYETPLIELTAKMDGQPVKFYAHAQCLMRLSMSVLSQHHRAVVRYTLRRTA